MQANLPNFSVTISNPQRLAINISGTLALLYVDRKCNPADDGLTVQYGKLGLHVIPVPAGSTSCVLRFSDALSRTDLGGKTMTLTIQVLSSSGASSPTPIPKPAAYPYDGQWSGALTGILTWATQPTTTQNLNIPVNASVTQGDFSSDNQFAGGDTGFGSLAGDAQNNDAQIPASGLWSSFTFWPELDIDPQSSDISHTYIGANQSCSFAMQFEKNGTATSVGKDGSPSSGATIICTGYTAHGTAASFAGKLTLIRTGT